MSLKRIVEQSDTRAGRWFDRVVSALIVVSLITFSIETLPNLPPAASAVLYWIEFATVLLPWCTTPIEAESSLGPDSHHPIISLSGIPSTVMVLRILHPILASPLCAANPLARIAEPTIAL